jgi:hypothetical protein
MYEYMTKLIDWRQCTEDNSRGAHLEEGGQDRLAWVPDNIIL